MNVKVIEQDKFKEEVLDDKKIVLVDFFATWCGPCKMLSPILSEVAENNHSVKIVSVNVDDSAELAEKYGVASIPCLVLFKEGVEVNRHVGLISKDELESFIGE